VAGLWVFCGCFVGGLADWWIGGLWIGGLVVCGLVDCWFVGVLLVDWRIGGLVDWWIGGLADWWIGGLADWWIGVLWFVGFIFVLSQPFGSTFPKG